jgi:hypothetical protein
MVLEMLIVSRGVLLIKLQNSKYIFRLVTYGKHRSLHYKNQPVNVVMETTDICCEKRQTHKYVKFMSKTQDFEC